MTDTPAKQTPKATGTPTTPTPSHGTPSGRTPVRAGAKGPKSKETFKLLIAFVIYFVLVSAGGYFVDNKKGHKAVAIYSVLIIILSLVFFLAFQFVVKKKKTD